MSDKKKSDKIRRIVMTVSGVSASGVAVGFFNYSAFGMDPFQVLAHGLWNLTSLGYGTFYTIFSHTIISNLQAKCTIFLTVYKNIKTLN